jgi:hypothetical protein
MSPDDIHRVIDQVIEEIRAQRPEIFASVTPLGTRDAKLRLMFTTYQHGNATARLVMGTGQIRIKAEVTIVDAASGGSLGTYFVSKESYLGGLVGAATSTDDVERGFARSVAEIFSGKS